MDNLTDPCSRFSLGFVDALSPLSVSRFCTSTGTSWARCMSATLAFCRSLDERSSCSSLVSSASTTTVSSELDSSASSSWSWFRPNSRRRRESSVSPVTAAEKVPSGVGSAADEAAQRNERTSLDDDSLAKEDELVRLFAERYRVRAKESRLAREESLGSENLVEEVPSADQKPVSLCTRREGKERTHERRQRKAGRRGGRYRHERKQHARVPCKSGQHRAALMLEKKMYTLAF